VQPFCLAPDSRRRRRRREVVFMLHKMHPLHAIIKGVTERSKVNGWITREHWDNYITVKICYWFSSLDEPNYITGLETGSWWQTCKGWLGRAWAQLLARVGWLILVSLLFVGVELGVSSCQKRLCVMVPTLWSVVAISASCLCIMYG
jgi:hypothetical protein